MDALIERLWERLDAYGIVGALLFAFIVGTAWVVRQLWWWGFREPDKNSDDDGGWMTQFFRSTMATQRRLVEMQEKTVDMQQKQMATSERHDAKLDLLIGRSPCLHKPDPGARA